MPATVGTSTDMMVLWLVKLSLTLPQKRSEAPVTPPSFSFYSKLWQKPYLITTNNKYTFWSFEIRVLVSDAIGLVQSTKLIIWQRKVKQDDGTFSGPLIYIMWHVMGKRIICEAFWVAQKPETTFYGISALLIVLFARVREGRKWRNAKWITSHVAKIFTIAIWHKLNESVDGNETLKIIYLLTTKWGLHLSCL